MTVKRIIMSALLGSIAAMALAVPAQAQMFAHKKKASCTIEGSATANVPWLSPGPDNPLGTYSFGPTGLGIDCVFVSKKNIGSGPVTKTDVEAGLAEVVGGSSGSFDNEVCGTGTAADPQPTVTSVATTPDSPDAEATLLNADLGYHIAFVAGEGALTWGDNASPGVPDANTAPSLTAPVGGGVINISPWRRPDSPVAPQTGIFPGDPPNGLCTNGFNVEGVVGGSLAGN